MIIDLRAENCRFCILTFQQKTPRGGQFYAHLPRSAISPGCPTLATSSPFGRNVKRKKKRRRTGAQNHHGESAQHHAGRGPAHDVAEHEFVRHELDQARVDQDAGADGIEDAVGDERGLRPRGERAPHAEADGDGDGRGKAIDQAEQIRGPFLGGVPWRGGEAGAESQAFKGLMKEEDHVERVEFFTGHGEREADEDGMEHDPELKDEDGRHLRGVVFRPAVFMPFEVVIDVFSGVAQVVFPGSVAGGGRDGVDPRRDGVGVGVDIVTVVVEGSVSHRHELGEEEKKDGHENDAFDPIIFRNGPCQTRVLESFMGRCKQLCQISLICRLLGSEPGYLSQSFISPEFFPQGAPSS